MQSIFENQCEYTRQNLLESQKAYQRSWPSVLFPISYTVIFGGYALYSLFHTISIYSILIGVLAALLIVLVWALPYLAAKKEADKQLEVCHRVPETLSQFYDDEFRFTNLTVHTELSIRYQQISRVIETEHLYLLWLPKKLFFMVRKDGFTKGDADAFIAFLQSKASGAKHTLYQ